MKKEFVFSLIACCMLALCCTSAPTSIQCNYNSLTFYILSDIYSCEVDNNPNIITEGSAVINSINGNHKPSDSDDNVGGLYVYNKILHHFPQNLENFFKNLNLIYINGCGLKEIHQEDLKPFVKLVFLYLGNNAIEVLEQDLFAFNQELEFISFDHNKIVHIDSKVFDHLDKLSCFWFTGVPCVNKEASNSKSDAKKLINLAKTQCLSSDFTNLEKKIVNLETEAKSLSFEGLRGKLEAFEKILKESKFFKFRPLKNKLEDLKRLQNSKLVATESPVTPSSVKTPESSLNSCQNEQTSALDTKIDSLSSNLSNRLTKIDSIIDDLKESQCGAKDTLTDFLTYQNSFKTSINDVKSSQNEVRSLINNLESKVSDLNTSQFDIKASQSNLKTSQDSLKLSQNQITSSINSLTTNLNNLKDTAKLSQDDLKTSISDIEATFSDLKIFQNEVKSGLNKIKTTQNEIKISLNEVKVNKNENSEEKFTNFGEKLENLDRKFEGKFENLEGHFGEFEVKNAEKLEKIEREFVTTRHKISVSFDEKIKGIEKRLMKKFEEVLEEKLGKILERNRE